MSAHKHRASRNPRKKGWCDCGAALGEQRDPEWERQAIEQVTIGIKVDYKGLTRRAQARAEQGEVQYGYEFPELSRDLLREAEHECLDGVNYVLWQLDRIRRGTDPSDWRVPSLQIALRHFALAYEEIRCAQ